MFQDISPYYFDNTYVPRDAQPGDIGVSVKDGKILCLVQDGILFLPVLSQGNASAAERYLFTIDGIGFFLTPAVEEMYGFRYRSYQEIYHLSPAWLVFSALTALRLGTWYEENRFCGKCGSHMEHSTAERMLRCPDCGNQVYPRISPAVIVAVRSGEKLLLTKYAQGYSHYALVAGFAESGETIEQTVQREVWEETGLKVKNITYFGSQPWPHSGSLLLGFVCDLSGNDAVTVQESELSTAEWVSRNDIPVQPDTLSLTSTMMEAFRKHEI